MITFNKGFITIFELVPGPGIGQAVSFLWLTETLNETEPLLKKCLPYTILIFPDQFSFLLYIMASKPAGKSSGASFRLSFFIVFSKWLGTSSRGRLAVSSPAPVACVSKCSRARHRTPHSKLLLKASVCACMCEWLPLLMSRWHLACQSLPPVCECGKCCKALRVFSRLEKCSINAGPFTGFHVFCASFCIYSAFIYA